MPTETFPANFVQLDNMREFVKQAASDCGMDEREAYAIQMATDEACSNIIEYAYNGAPGGTIEIDCRPVDGALEIVIRDDGKPFDPATVPEPDVHAVLKDRHIGGLGLYLMRKLMDEVRFETLPDGGNRLTMIKRVGVAK
jgi:serine/threonine-protein kinase RsbW